MRRVVVSLSTHIHNYSYIIESGLVVNGDMCLMELKSSELLRLPHPNNYH